MRDSLSPAATWKGSIGKGKITLSYTLPKPEEVVISKPRDRFKKIGDTKFEWDFQNLKPTLADDIKIVVHPASDTYAATGEDAVKQDDQTFLAEYVFEAKRYYLQHSDYDAVASSTRPTEPAPTPDPAKSPSDDNGMEPEGERNYDVNNIKGVMAGNWAEGVEGDGIGENITLTVRRPLPLDAIMIRPGYHDQYYDRKGEVWAQKNRVAALEITFNGEHTFVATLPDEKLIGLYPIPVRGYAKPVKTVKLAIKAVHRGTGARDTCISQVSLRAKLSQKPKYHQSR